MEYLPISHKFDEFIHELKQTVPSLTNFPDGNKFIEYILNQLPTARALNPIHVEGLSRKAAKSPIERNAENIAELKHAFDNLSFYGRLLFKNQSFQLHQLLSKDEKLAHIYKLIEDAVRELKQLRSTILADRLAEQKLKSLSELLQLIDKELNTYQLAGYHYDIELALIRMEYYQEIGNNYAQFAIAVDNTISRALADPTVSDEAKESFRILQNESSRLNLSGRAKALEAQRALCFNNDGSIDKKKFNAYQEKFKRYKQDCEQFKQLVIEQREKLGVNERKYANELLSHISKLDKNNLTSTKKLSNKEAVIYKKYKKESISKQDISKTLSNLAENLGQLPGSQFKELKKLIESYGQKVERSTDNQQISQLLNQAISAIQNSLVQSGVDIQKPLEKTLKQLKQMADLIKFQPGKLPRASVAQKSIPATASKTQVSQQPADTKAFRSKAGVASPAKEFSFKNYKDRFSFFRQQARTEDINPIKLIKLSDSEKKDIIKLYKKIKKIYENIDLSGVTPDKVSNFKDKLQELTKLSGQLFDQAKQGNQIGSKDLEKLKETIQQACETFPQNEDLIELDEILQSVEQSLLPTNSTRMQA